MPQWPRWQAGQLRRRPGSGNHWPAGCRTSRWRRPATRRRKKAGARRSPRGSSRRPVRHVGLRKIGRRLLAGSGQW
eukprot:13775706-Alexandrium_andersonii.AAC.1